MKNSEGFWCYPIGLPGPSAIYLLVLRGEIVYVGQSLNVFARVASHHQRLTRIRRGLSAKRMHENWNIEAIVFDEVRIRPCARQDLDKEELELIQRYRPKHNKLLNRPKVKISNLKIFNDFFVQKRMDREEIKRRKLPDEVAKVEKSFRTYRDQRQRITTPKLRFLEDVV